MIKGGWPTETLRFDMISCHFYIDAHERRSFYCLFIRQSTDEPLGLCRLRAMLLLSAVIENSRSKQCATPRHTKDGMVGFLRVVHVSPNVQIDACCSDMMLLCHRYRFPIPLIDVLEQGPMLYEQNSIKSGCLKLSDTVTSIEQGRANADELLVAS